MNKKMSQRHTVDLWGMEDLAGKANDELNM